MSKIDRVLLHAYMAEFLGYGDADADLWFCGLEEGGEGSEAMLARRLDSWRRAGRQPLMDLCELHQRIGVTDLFEGRVRIQRTWRSLIQLWLGYLGEPFDRESVRRCQANRFGRLGGGVALVELLPLPKPRQRDWPFAGLAGASPERATRREYARHWRPRRVAALRNAIDAARPRCVVFYGLTERACWRQIAGGELVRDEAGIEHGERNGVRYALLPHPAARGVTRGVFQQAGARLSACADQDRLS